MYTRTTDQNKTEQNSVQLEQREERWCWWCLRKTDPMMMTRKKSVEKSGHCCAEIVLFLWWVSAAEAANGARKRRKAAKNEEWSKEEMERTFILNNTFTKCWNILRKSSYEKKEIKVREKKTEPRRRWLVKSKGKTRRKQQRDGNIYSSWFIPAS